MSDHTFDNEVDGLTYCSRCGWWQGAARGACERVDGVIDVRLDDGRAVAARLVTTVPLLNGVARLTETRPTTAETIATARTYLDHANKELARMAAGVLLMADLPGEEATRAFLAGAAWRVNATVDNDAWDAAAEYVAGRRAEEGWNRTPAAATPAVSTLPEIKPYPQSAPPVPSAPYHADMGGATASRTAWIYCGGCQRPGGCPIPTCTNHRSAPRG